MGMMLDGEHLPKLLMTVIRFCINTDNHELKKLLMLFWEIAPKYDADHKLLPEMILVCNALRNDLNHSNEFIRGSMLRCLCKLHEPEIIEPLTPSIKSCLEHRHSYVRKNAALALYHVHKHFGHALVPDGAEIMERFVSAETELGSRRNAFLMLVNEAEEMAIDFLRTNAEDFDRFGDGFALLVLELTRKVCRREPSFKAQFVRFLFQLLGSSSAAVSYETAWTLVSLSSAPTAIRAAASTYTALLCSQSDNNVKLIVLERLAEIKQRHPRVLAEILMDILRALSSPNVDICKRTLEIAMDLVSPRNIEEVIQVLKREVIRTRTAELEQNFEYRALLIDSMHTCAMKYPEVASSVVPVVMEFLGSEGAGEVVVFVRSIVQQYPSLRVEILEKLLNAFHEIRTAPVLATALWVLGEYLEGDLVESGFDMITSCVGGSFLASSEVPIPQVGTERTTESLGVTRSVILPDGTYATHPMSEDTSTPVHTTAVLRRLICEGDMFLGTVTAGTLTKLACKTMRSFGPCASVSKQRQVTALKLCCDLSELAQNKVACSALEATNGKAKCLLEENQVRDGSAVADCVERLVFFTNVLLDPSFTEFHAYFLQDSKNSFEDTFMSSASSNAQMSHNTSTTVQSLVSAAHQPDDLILWRQLRQGESNTVDFELCDVGDLTRATGMSEATDDYGVRLSHVHQLAGFADPIYAEASVTVHDYDIVLEITVVNRTTSTLTNLTVELATMGDLKLVERPQSLTVGPLDQHTIRANIKVSSTETGHIFGTIVYEKSSTAEKSYINLNSVHLDIMDYIRPASCSDEQFRQMWAEFEWENKVAIATVIPSLGEFLDHIVQSTNMCCLTPRSALEGASCFLAANLYAKSIFGEDALVNVSVEKKDDADGKLSGYVRIRSKTQGIALSLGDRITAVQRGQRIQG
mmetsp:Transcript_6230/g.26099  ORF Transcript_6230/g.26099 Transcript_6230/m.26099 type:complete len:924 (+) Transcript_6230:252-3023(+)